jgi:hypothetical protein
MTMRRKKTDAAACRPHLDHVQELPDIEIDAIGGEAGGSGGQLKGSGLGTGFDYRDAMAVESSAVVGFVGVMVGGVAITDAQDLTGAGELEGNTIGGIGNDAALFVQNGNGNHDGILAIRREGGAGGRKLDAKGCAGGFNDVGGDGLAGGGGDGAKLAGLIRNQPFGIGVEGHWFHAEALAVQEKLNMLCVAEGKDADGLSFATGPVPGAGQQVNHGRVRPAGFKVIVFVLGETAGIKEPGVVGDVGPAIGIRLAFIVEAGPGEGAGEKRAAGDGEPIFHAQVVSTAHAGERVIGGRVFAAGGFFVGVFAAKEGLVGITAVGGVIAGGVVINSNNVVGIGDAVGEKTAGHGAGDGTGGVIEMDDALHAGEEVPAFRFALQGFLIAHGPHDDAGMIPVPQNHGGEVGKIRAGGAGRGLGALGVGKVAVFIHDHQAQAVAGIEQGSAGRVMRGAPGVAAHFFELLNAPGLEAIGHGDTKAGKILMAGQSLDFNAPAVQEEAFVRVVMDGANAEGGDGGIHRDAVLKNSGAELVERGGLDGPQLWVANDRLLEGSGLIITGHDLIGTEGLKHLTVRPEEVGYNLAVGGGSLTVFDGGLDAEVGEVVRALVAIGNSGNDISSVLRDVNRGKGGQINMAINAAAFIPPAFKLARIHAHGDDVIGAGFGDTRDVVGERGVAAGMASEKLPVQPNLAIAKDAVKIQPEDFALAGRGDYQMFAIPGHFVGQVGVTPSVMVFGKGVSAFENVVMRNINMLPLGVIVVRSDSLIVGEVTGMKQPIGVQQGLLPHRWRGSRGTGAGTGAGGLGFRAGREGRGSRTRQNQGESAETH